MTCDLKGKRPAHLHASSPTGMKHWHDTQTLAAISSYINLTRMAIWTLAIPTVLQEVSNPSFLFEYFTFKLMMITLSE